MARAKTYSSWEDNIGLDTHLGAIRWKAAQEKDSKHICSSHSEDRLTWIAFRAFERMGLLPRYCTDLLGLPASERVEVLYWQRLPGSQCLHPDVNASLAEIEPWHTEKKRQRTETDMILVGDHWLCVCEHKCGVASAEPTGWQQRSQLRPEYERWFRPLLRKPDQWRMLGQRFAQLLKNLSLAMVLARHWAVNGSPRAAHLAVVVSDHVKGPSGVTYSSELDVLRDEIILAYSDSLHLTMWREIKRLLDSRPEIIARQASAALAENDWL